MDGLRQILRAWQKAIQVAGTHKQARFGKDADDGMRLLTGPYDWLYDGMGVNDKHFGVQQDKDGAMPVMPTAPAFRMQVNKTAEFVQLFAPYLYHKNPHRTVTPRKPFNLDPNVFQAMAQIDPMQAQAISQLMYQGAAQAIPDLIRTELQSSYLNATPNPLNLKQEAQLWVDESLVKGASCLWTESYVPDGTTARVSGSFHETIDNIIFDTGVKKIEDAKWLARRRVMSVKDASIKFGIAPERFKPAIESNAAQAAIGSDSLDGVNRRARQASYDVIVYWEIYTRNGLCSDMKSMLSPEAQQLGEALALPGEAGKFSYICYCERMDFPLNCPPELFDAAATPEALDEIKRRFAWPIPFWADGSWPCTLLYYHTIPNDPWPMSHLSPAFGELKFLNWFHSYIAGKVLITSRDWIAVKNKAKAAIKDAIQHGADLSIIYLDEQDGPISNIVQFLSSPQINGDVFKVAEIIERQFEKRTGMTELMYGFTGTQIRSATEAEIKQGAITARPDDMAERVETAMSQVARLEAIAARFTLQGSDVAFMCGPVAGSLWDAYVVPSDPAKSLYETDYRIEAGSIRKPNRSRDAENANAMIQTFGPIFQGVYQMGNPGPLNAVIAEWCKTKDINPAPFMLQPPMPPPMPAPAEGGGESAAQAA